MGRLRARGPRRSRSANHGERRARSPAASSCVTTIRSIHVCDPGTDARLSTSVTAGSGESHGAGHAEGPRGRAVRACRRGRRLRPPGVERESRAAIARLRQLPGVGEWTRNTSRCVCSREPDAFPAADIALLRSMADRRGCRPTPEALLARAERWRPWRARGAIPVDGHTREPRPSRGVIRLPAARGFFREELPKRAAG